MLYQLSYEATCWERGQFIEFISPMRSEMMQSMYEIIHIWTAAVDESEEWSSQLIYQFKQLERRSLKISRLQQHSNPWPPRYRCDVLPTEQGSHSITWLYLKYVGIFVRGHYRFREANSFPRAKLDVDCELCNARSFENWGIFLDIPQFLLGTIRS